MSDKTHAFAKDLAREKWLTLLETGNLHQCRGKFRLLTLAANITTPAVMAADGGDAVDMEATFHAEESFCALGVYIHKVLRTRPLAFGSWDHLCNKIEAETGVPRNIISEIPRLNDTLAWPLPRIAEWIREQMAAAKGE